MPVPVYLFCGFLDAGKTTFVQETLEDPEFNTGEKTLLLLCEEGEIEYDAARFAGGNVNVVVLNEESSLTREFFQTYKKKHRTDRALLEYNGMWKLQTLYEALPDDWQIFQFATIADSTTFASYLNNMRQQTVDKLQDPELVVFNRCTPKTDFTTLHRSVRMVNRRAQILFEHTDGTIAPDEVKDPLPYDVKAPVITIKEEDFGIFYLDVFDEPEVYDGKTIQFKAYVCQTPRVPAGCFAAGRFAMTCCANDISYIGVICQAENASSYGHRTWADVTAKITFRKHALYEGMGPWLIASSVQPSQPPAEELVYFLR